MLRFGDTLRGDGQGTVSDPAPFPLLPIDGDSFLDGSIKADEYLAEKRALERKKALTELDGSRRIERSMAISSITAIVTVVVAVANIAVVLSALFNNYFSVALGGLLMVVLGTAIAARQLLYLNRHR